MPELDTVVIGAGQAGLATSHHLTQRGIEHVVLERGNVANTWRTERWDGFYLNTPKFTQQLPGFEYSGPDPDGFSSLAETLRYLDEYAAVASPSIRTGTNVTGLRVVGDGFRLELEGDALDARNVVVATGAYQRPTSTPLRERVPSGVQQLHSSEYRRPAGLAEGAVLVVGSGQSGCQIADELIRSGRTVYLSVGRCAWAPRRYRGREILHWLIESGFMDQPVDSLPSPTARLGCNPPISGNDGGHDCHPRWLAGRGAVLTGRVADFDRHTALFDSNLEPDLAWGAALVADILGKVDEHIAARGLDVPEAEPGEPAQPLPSIETLDLREAGISTILWSNGFRPAFGWIDLPLFDDHGWPLQEQGVTAVPGLYFVGLHWLHKRKSSLLFGVGEDAEHVVAHLAGRSRPPE